MLIQEIFLSIFSHTQMLEKKSTPLAKGAWPTVKLLK